MCAADKPSPPPAGTCPILGCTLDYGHAGPCVKPSPPPETTERMTDQMFNQIADPLRTTLGDIQPLVAEARRAREAEERLTAENDDLHDRLGRLLCRLTDGRMSKTNYDVETMVAEVEDVHEKHTQEIVVEEIATRDAEIERLRGEVELAGDTFKYQVEKIESLQDALGKAEAERDRLREALAQIAALRAEIAAARLRENVLFRTRDELTARVEWLKRKHDDQTNRADKAEAERDRLREDTRKSVNALIDMLDPIDTLTIYTVEQRLCVEIRERISRARVHLDAWKAALAGGGEK